ncbi:MAG TPA: hypothetical protein VJS92_03565, partial [Candidatus Polarisedimenticolaceae bacterium]|nr:hypothetical protein [Candidatus Polarisedimenticolaceae bacterium]
ALAAACAPPARSNPVRRAWSPARGSLAALVALAALVTGLYVLQRKSAYLELDARSGLPSGTLTLLVDGDTVFARELAAPAPRSGGRRLIDRVFKRGLESFGAHIAVPPGHHELVGRVAAAGIAAPLEDRLVVELAPGETRTLRLVAGRSFNTRLSLELE